MTLTERMREQVRAAAKVCPCCGSDRAGGIRVLAAKIGVPHTVLWRFLRGDSPSGRTLDAIDAWLARNGGTE